MNCRDFENLILAERDGALPESQCADLARHVAGCASCQRLQSDLAAAATAWRARTAQVTVPDPETEWRKVRPRISGAKVQTAPKRRLAPIIWLATPLAAAAALVFAFVLSPGPAPESTGALARADYVETGNAQASTMVYSDKESGWVVVWATNAKAKSSG